MPQLKAVVSDMDGTLFNDSHNMSQHTASVLRRLKEAGIYFIVATGRPYADVFARMKECDLHPDYIITSNGARVHDGNFNLVIEHNLDPSLVRGLSCIEVQPNEDGTLPEVGTAPKRFATNLYREGEWLTDKGIPKLSGAFHPTFQYQDLGKKFYSLSDDELRGVHELWYVGERADLMPLYRHFERYYGDRVSYTFSMEKILDAVGLHVSKGTAVREVAAKLGIDVADIACFGDGMNDYSMLHVCGKSYVMENAQQELKQKLPQAEIIGRNNNDGVAAKLEELLSEMDC